ncbi:hypothetical protein AYO38_03740 [bacterium SCGC AG-212-C10]|nr:hypothetical protein AYO38_03740 [bacterium SCGC AG-212-C10]
MAEQAFPPLIIEAAINGATPKSRNPASPRTPAEIAEVGLACLEAGASIIHNHNDEGLLDRPGSAHSAEPYIEAWRAILAKRPDALLYPTMGGGGEGIDIAVRYAHIPALAEAGVMRVGLVDPGSVNVGGMSREGIPAGNLTYINTFADADYMVRTCFEHKLGPSISCFEPGFVRVALAHHRAGTLPPGSMVKFYFGGEFANFGLPATEPSLNAYVSMLEGTGLQWSVAALSGDVVGCGMAELAIRRGGHVRVGLEDYAGPRKPNNVELVEELVALAKSCGRAVATPTEAAAILGLQLPAYGATG